MCGLVGVMGDIDIYDRRAMKDLLVVDILRGKHSTGVASVSRVGSVNLFKKAYNAVDFLDTAGGKGVVDDLSNACIIGHNRYATKGIINNVNAHPFEFSNVVGAHNGTLTSYYQLDDYRSFDVDSECLYSHLNDHGIDDVFNKANGAFALTWYDKQDGKLKMLRNSQRPLHYCFSADRKKLYWASEPWMLIAVLWRNEIAHTDVVPCAEDTLYTFDVPKGVMTKNDTLSNPHARKLIKKVIPKKSTNHSLTSITGGKENYNNVSQYASKEIEFYVDRRVDSATSAEYFKCRLAEDYNVEVRLYISKKDPMYNTLSISANNFKAKCRAAKFHLGQAYLLINYRTLEEVECSTPFDEDIEEDNGDIPVLVEGFNGEYLDYTQFMEATQNGCSWCTGPADFNKPPKFITKDAFVCHHCIDDPEIKQYVGDLH